MDNFIPDSSQLKSLKTWYPVDHDLHFDPRHPCIKLAGEAGELLDLYGKEEYKPGFSWWECKVCKHGTTNLKVHANCKDYCLHTCCKCKKYNPLVLDELGDYSYYLRILSYQNEVTFEELCRGFRAEWFIDRDDNLAELLLELLSDSARVLEHFLYDNRIMLPYLRDSAYTFLAILHKLDCSLDNLLELNYRKLNSEESHHGWRDATIKSRA